MAETFVIGDEKRRALALRSLMKLDLEKPWKVTIAPCKRSRSLEQNNLYHKWIGIIAAETGNSHDDIHEWCKDEFLPPVIIEVAGVTKEVRRSTTKLKVDEMSAYMTAVQAWAASEMGILLPVPEEMHERAA